MTSSVLAFVDEWWGILVPVILGMIFRGEIMDAWKYLKLRASKKPYSNCGNFVWFDKGGPKWKIHDMDKAIVELYEVDENRTPTGVGMKMTTKDFIGCKYYFEADI